MAPIPTVRIRPKGSTAEAQEILVNEPDLGGWVGEDKEGKTIVRDGHEWEVAPARASDLAGEGSGIAVEHAELMVVIDEFRPATISRVEFVRNVILSARSMGEEIEQRGRQIADLTSRVQSLQTGAAANEAKAASETVTKLPEHMVPARADLESMNLSTLRDIAKDIGVDSKNLNKAELVDAIVAAGKVS